MNKKFFLMLAASFIGCVAQAQIVEYFEDTYGKQASPELVKQTEEVAKLVGFEGLYQVVASKKAGIDVNPALFKFITTGDNQQMHYPFMLINTAWFDTLPQDQQTFLLAHAFVKFKEGVLPASVKYLPYVFIVLFVLLLLFIFWLLGKTPLAAYKKWVRVLAAWALAVCFNLAIGNSLQTKTIQYFAKKHDMHVIRMAVEKTGNKEAAKEALLAYNAGIQEEIKNGQTAFVPFGNFFEQYANEL